MYGAYLSSLKCFIQTLTSKIYNFLTKFTESNKILYKFEINNIISQQLWNILANRNYSPQKSHKL